MCVGPFDEINFSAQMERRELANIFRPLETNDVLPSFSFRRREPPFHRLRDVYAGDHFRSSSVAFLRFLRCSRSLRSPLHAPRAGFLVRGVAGRRPPPRNEADGDLKAAHFPQKERLGWLKRGEEDVRDSFQARR